MRIENDENIGDDSNGSDDSTGSCTPLVLLLMIMIEIYLLCLITTFYTLSLYSLLQCIILYGPIPS
jgi:hypothetical protein